MSDVAQQRAAIMYAMTTSNDPTERLKLAELVRNRRLHLGLSVRQAADAAHVARGTWTALEEGARRTADNNYAGIERALNWTPGSITNILNGGAPGILHIVNLADSVPISDSASAVVRSATQAQAEHDEALSRVMRSDRLTDQQKREIVEVLLDEKRDAERRRIEHAEQLIRFAARPE